MLPHLIQRTDGYLFYVINRNIQNSIFDFIMPFITEAGSAYLITAAGLFLLISNRKKLKSLGFMILSGLAVSETVSTILKGVFARPRPAFVIENIRLLCHKSYTGSFPSGHTTLFFTVAAIIVSAYPRTAPIVFALAIVAGFSRVYVGAHFPTDVIAGAVLGLLIGGIIAYIWRKSFSSPGHQQKSA